MVASGKCGCGDDSANSPFKKKEEGKCPEKPSTEKETKKKSCFPLNYKEDKGKCHSSHEQFKQKSSDKCQSSEDTFSQKDKCHSSREEFFKGGKGQTDSCGQSDESDKQCHESLKQFFKAKTDSPCGQLDKSDKKCHDSLPFSKEKTKSPCGRADNSGKKCQDALPFLKEKAENPCCGRADKSGKQCHDSLPFLKEKKENQCKKSNKSDKQCHDALPFLKERTEEKKCPSPYNMMSDKKRSSCSSPPKCAQAKEEKPPCTSSFDKSKEDSTLSKLSSYCKKLAKQCMSSKSKSKCSSVKSTCGEKLSLPEKGLACPPTVETGCRPKPAIQPCSSQGSCPEIKKHLLTDFFPLDARNKQLNECIEKYMKLDPGQVISKCSRFANKTSDLSEKCLETIKKSQMKCVGLVKSSGAGKMTTALMSTRGRYMMTRWGPTTAAYLTTAALLTVYVTEWKAVLKHVPLYSHLGLEEENINK